MSICEELEYACAAFTTLLTNKCCSLTSIEVKSVLVEKPKPPFDNWYSINPVALSIAVALTNPCLPTSAITLNSSPLTKSWPPNVISTEESDPVTVSYTHLRAHET